MSKQIHNETILRLEGLLSQATSVDLAIIDRSHGVVFTDIQSIVDFAVDTGWNLGTYRGGKFDYRSQAELVLMQESGNYTPLFTDYGHETHLGLKNGGPAQVHLDLRAAGSQESHGTWVYFTYGVSLESKQ